MADSSSTNVILGAVGNGQQVTSAGLLFTQATAPAGSQPYWNYDGTNLVGNVPTGKGFAFAVNGANKVTIDTSGSVLGGAGAAFGAVTGNSVFGGVAGGSFTTVRGAVADGSSAICVIVNNSTTLSTSGAMLAVTQNNGAQRVAQTFDGVVVASGLALGAFPGTVTTTTMLTGPQAIIPCNTTGGAFTLTLWNGTKGGAGSGGLVAIKCVATSANALTVKGWGSQTIEGSATLTITPSTQKEGVWLAFDGVSNWMICGAFSAAL